MKFIFGFCIYVGMFFACGMAMADPIVIPDAPVSDTFISADDILYVAPSDTQCATAEFANALARTAGMVSESDSEDKISQWIHQTFASGDVLSAVLACPEIASLDENETIKFLPIEYTFSMGRVVRINYETQPKILKHRLTLANKRDFPGTDDPNPRIAALDDGAVWANTDPAWYAIMVVKHGALDEFVGAGKNNSVSTQWIEDNIDAIWPGVGCTNKTAWARDSAEINDAVKRTVGIGITDSNDYYVAGDANLQWVAYAEIAAEVALTVFTAGGFLGVKGATTAARASRMSKKLTTSVRGLSKLDSVRDYMSVLKKYEKATDELDKLNRLTDFKKYSEKSADVAKIADKMKELESADDKVKQFAAEWKSLKELNDVRWSLKGIKFAKRGNVASRAWKAFQATRKGGGKIKSARKLVAKNSNLANRVRDRLFDTTLATAGGAAGMGGIGAIIYGGLRFAGDFWDYTETSTGEFTNNIEFKPLCLLSADDLTGDGMDNKVNYGMWLMWMGDGRDPAADDSAYLQAMDFAQKFHQDLLEIQDERGTSLCAVDIYVVRPVIRNPDTDSAALYYLVMNDAPWTTVE